MPKRERERGENEKQLTIRRQQMLLVQIRMLLLFEKMAQMLTPDKKREN